MPAPRPIALSASDHERLLSVIARLTFALSNAQVLLNLSAGWIGAQIVDAYGVSQNTVGTVYTRFLHGRLDAVLSDKRQQWRPPSPADAQCLACRRSQSHA